MIEDATRPLILGGNARHFSGTIHVDYATRASWIGKTFHYAINTPATAMTWFTPAGFNEADLRLRGKLAYFATGDSPALQELPFHGVPLTYLIPKGYQKYLPEAVAFCRDNAQRLQASQDDRGILTAQIASPNPFLQLLAFRALSEDKVAMQSSTAPDQMIHAAASPRRASCSRPWLLSYWARKARPQRSWWRRSR